MVASIKANNTTNENDLIALAREQDESAIRTIISRNNRRLFRMARGILRDDNEAEDVVQETYMRAFAKLSEFRGDSSLSTWLGRIAINEALGRLRCQRKVPEMLPIEKINNSSGQVIPFPLINKHPDPEKAMAQNQIHTLLQQAIDALPENFRMVLIMRTVEEMSIEETSELLGIKPETIKTRLHRAREMLRDSMNEQIGPMLTTAFPFGGMRCQRIADEVVRKLAALPV